MKTLEVGKPIYIEFVAFNVGNTPARDTEAEITVEVRDMPMSIGGYETKRWTGLADIERNIAAGDAVFASKNTLIFEREWWPRGGAIPDDWATDRIVVIGRILYADDNQVKRRTAFYRFCTNDVNRFHLPDFSPATLADHEYED